MAIKDLTKDDAEILLGWLNDDKFSAYEDDPSVGIFVNEALGEAFAELQEYVEGQTGVKLRTE